MNNCIESKRNQLESRVQVRSLIKLFLSGKSPKTIEAYSADLRDFCAFLGVNTPEEAARLLLSESAGHANENVLGYRNSLLERDLSSATVNRRLASVRSLVNLGQMLGIVNWTLSVPGVRQTRQRNMSGPSVPVFVQMLNSLKKKDTIKAKRDYAILRLLHDVALRRGEISALNVGDWKQEDGTLAIKGKGDREKTLINLPKPTREALAAWVERLSDTDSHASLFTNLDRAGKGCRITGRSIHRIVAKLGEELGVKVRPHGLRHRGITTALEMTGGDVRRVARYSRHRDVQVVLAYDDERTNPADEIAEMVASVAG